jgi:hypothetical protein
MPLKGYDNNYLHPFNFLKVLAKDINFESKVGHCTAANENLNVQ